MAGVVLEFAQFGNFDSFDIIRSTSSMMTIPDHLLPAPIATGLTTMLYVDTAVIENTMYYYKARVWRSSESVVSDEIQVLAVLAYRYLRIWITADNGQDQYTEFQEIEIATSIGGPDITTPSSPTWESSYLIAGVHRNAQKLVDNNFTVINNIWTSDGVQGFPRWVSFDLGSNVVVREIRIWPTYDTSFGDFTGRAPKDFIIQGSNDNETWRDIKEVTNMTDWARGSPQVITIGG